MKRLRVSSAFNLHGIPSGDFAAFVEAGLRFYREKGFDTVDFDLTLLNLDGEGWKEETEAALAACEKHGLRFEIGHLPFTGGETQGEEMEAFCEKMHRAIDAAALLGLGYAVMHPNTSTLPMARYDRAAQHEKIMRHLAPFVEHADRVGLKTVVENMRIVPGMRYAHRYCQFPDELCDVADALGLGVCWDFGHANISGVRQSEGIGYVGKRLKVIHVNDNSAVDDEHILPFTGSVDWRDAMHGLAKVGFEGLFNFELAAEKIPDGMRGAYADYVLTAAGELMGYIV